jgi:hypothetical protein
MLCCTTNFVTLCCGVNFVVLHCFQILLCYVTSFVALHFIALQMCCIVLQTLLHCIVLNKSKTTHTQKQEVQDPWSFIELHHLRKHVNKPNNTKKVGSRRTLAHMKKMMSLMRSIVCQVQPHVKFSPSWLLEPTHTNNNEHEQGCTQNNNE